MSSKMSLAPADKLISQTAHDILRAPQHVHHTRKRLLDQIVSTIASQSLGHSFGVTHVAFTASQAHVTELNKFASPPAKQNCQVFLTVRQMGVFNVAQIVAVFDETDASNRYIKRKRS